MLRLAFALVILLLFSFAFDPGPRQTRESSGGLLWIVFAFAGTLILNRSFARELANDCLDALSRRPPAAPRCSWAKRWPTSCCCSSVELVSLPVFGIFYNVRWTAQIWPLLLVLALGTWGLTVIGTMFSALTVNIRLRELMLPHAGLSHADSGPDGRHAVDHVLMAGEPLGGENQIWLRLLVGFRCDLYAVSGC